MSLKVGIVGAAGYAGAELIRLMLGHPEFELVAITSNACLLYTSPSPRDCS